MNISVGGEIQTAIANPRLQVALKFTVQSLACMAMCFQGSL